MKSIFNRAPLVPNRMAPLSLGSIRPEGWLQEQMRTQAEGLTARLGEVWADVDDTCAWLGGEGDGWERAPYYLDGLIPLAWGLDDEEMKNTALKYIECILASARPDGWFGPEKNTDHWPLMIALKALWQYFTATGDKRVLKLMDGYFKYQYKNLDEHPLKGWAVARGGENMYLALMLYNLTGQKYLLELVKKLRAQTLDWPNWFHTFPQTQPMGRALPWKRLTEALEEEKAEKLQGEMRPYFGTQYHLTHVVNVAMGLKTPGVINMFKSGFKEQGGFRFGWEKLMKYHGVANGMFTGDEHLNGNNPAQGTETCAVVELMHSLETLLGAGDYGPELADILEKVAYNALPAAFTPDMTAHQYDQQANQIRVGVTERPWYNNSSDSNVYGFMPNFGCCTANYHQGWPKFCASLWYATDDDGLSAVSYAPCTVKTRIAGAPVKMEVAGQYPYTDEVTMTISLKQPMEFPLYLRVPFWAKQPMIYLPDGEIMQVRAGETTCVRRRWRSGDVVRLSMPMEARITRWYHQSAAVEVGPMLLALQPEEKWTEIKKYDFGVSDWAVEPESDMNYALLKDEPMKVVLEPEKAGAFGKGEAAMHVLCKAAKVDWDMSGANCASVPILPEYRKADIETIRLVPYGATGLRISQFPIGGAEK